MKPPLSIIPILGLLIVFVNAASIPNQETTQDTIVVAKSDGDVSEVGF